MANLPLINFLQSLDHNSGSLTDLLHQISGRQNVFPTSGAPVGAPVGAPIVQPPNPLTAMVQQLSHPQLNGPATMQGGGGIDQLQGGDYTMQPQVRMEGVSDSARAAWDNLMQRWDGPDLSMTSAYRDPNYNAKVGGVKGSEHIQGNAFDIDASKLTMDQRMRLVAEARQAGFNGFGSYNDGSMHMDVRAKPAVWGESRHGDTAPGWLREAGLGDLPNGGDNLSGGGGYDNLQGGTTTTPNSFLGNLVSPINNFLTGMGFPGANKGSAQGGMSTSHGETSSNSQQDSTNRGNTTGFNVNQSNGTSRTRSGTDAPQLSAADFEESEAQRKRDKWGAIFGVLGKGLGQMSHGDAVDTLDVLKYYQQRRQDAYDRAMGLAQENRMRSANWSETVNSGFDSSRSGGTSDSTGRTTGSDQGMSDTTGTTVGATGEFDPEENRKAYLAAHPQVNKDDLYFYETNDGSQMVYNIQTKEREEIKPPPGRNSGSGIIEIPQPPPRIEPKTTIGPGGEVVVDPTFKNQQPPSPYSAPQIWDPKTGTYRDILGTDSFSGIDQEGMRKANALSKSSGFAMQYPEVARADQYFDSVKSRVMGVLNAQNITGKTIAAEYDDLKDLIPDSRGLRGESVDPVQAAMSYRSFRDRLASERDNIISLYNTADTTIAGTKKTEMAAQANAYAEAIAILDGALRVLPDPRAETEVPAGLAEEANKYLPRP